MLARRAVLETMQEMRWDKWQSQQLLPMWTVLRFSGGGPDGYYLRPNFKYQFFARIVEVNPGDSGWAWGNRR